MTPSQLTTVHGKSMDLLKNQGAAIHDDQTLKLCRGHGFAVSGKRVFPTEQQIVSALSTVPSAITIEARDQARSLTIGNNDCTFLPGRGSGAVITSEGERRKATMEDYDTFCKLAHTSNQVDVNGWMMVDPTDMPGKTVHLDMILSNMLLCDKPLFGHPLSAQVTLDGIEMVSRLWGGRESIVNKPVSVALLYPAQPLHFSADMLRSLQLIVSNGQSCIIGSRSALDWAETDDVYEQLSLQNAEVLTGIVLSQLIQEGAPVVYGALTVPWRKSRNGQLHRTPGYTIEANHTARLAGMYAVPAAAEITCTDAFFPDAQAGAESALSLYTAASSGINLVMQACGLLGSCQAMSFEKFLLDEEICGIVRMLLGCLPLPEQAIAGGGKALEGTNQGNTRQTAGCLPPEELMPSLMRKTAYADWLGSGKMLLHERADDQLTRRLAKYEKPDIDPAIEQDLTEYVNQRKTASVVKT